MDIFDDLIIETSNDIVKSSATKPRGASRISFDEFDMLARRDQPVTQKTKKPSRRRSSLPEMMFQSNDRPVRSESIIKTSRRASVLVPTGEAHIVEGVDTSTRESHICGFDGCDKPSVVHGYCSDHPFFAKGISPTSRVRQLFKLWTIEQELPSNADPGTRVIWRFFEGPTKSHSIEAYTNPNVSVIANDGKVIFNSSTNAAHSGVPPKRIVEFDVGTIHCDLIILRDEDMDTVTYELRMNDISWSDSQRQWIQQRLSDEALRSATSTFPFPVMQQDYVKKNWRKSKKLATTKMGMKKMISTWNFSLRGITHTIVLEHGQFGGKRKILVDGQVVIEKKLGMLEPETGGVFNLTVDRIPCIVKIVLNTKQESKNVWDYELVIDDVPFDDNTLTACGYGGNDAWDVNRFADLSPEELEEMNS